MANLIKTFEKVNKKTHQLQVLEITATVNSLEEAMNLGYNDFEINLFINHKFIADISPVLDQTGIYNDLIDSIDWVWLYVEVLACKKEGTSC